MLLSTITLTAAFTAPIIPHSTQGTPVMSVGPTFDRRQALKASGSAILLATLMPLSGNAAVTADGGNQAIDNSALRFNNKNLGGGVSNSASTLDETERAMAAIAQKNRDRAAEEARKQAARYQTEEEMERERMEKQQESKNLILGIAAGGTLLSGAFIIPNLRRLGIKVASGGADTGYDQVPATKAKKSNVKRANQQDELIDNPPFGGIFRPGGR